MNHVTLQVKMYNYELGNPYHMNNIILGSNGRTVHLLKERCKTTKEMKAHDRKYELIEMSGTKNDLIN